MCPLAQKEEAVQLYQIRSTSHFGTVYDIGAEHITQQKICTSYCCTSKYMAPRTTHKHIHTHTSATGPLTLHRHNPDAFLVQCTHRSITNKNKMKTS